MNTIDHGTTKMVKKLRTHAKVNASLHRVTDGLVRAGQAFEVWGERAVIFIVTNDGTRRRYAEHYLVITPDNVGWVMSTSWKIVK